MVSRHQYEISDLISRNILLIGDGYRAKNIELKAEGIPFARAGNILDNEFDFKNVDFMPSDGLSKVGNKISRPDDIVFTSKGTVGRFAYVREETQSFVYSPQLCFWRVYDTDTLDPRYLFYWMQGPEFTNQCDSVKGQTDMAEYVSLKDQRNMKITLPPLPEQRAIARILGALDDKIELNRRMNATLEAMAQAIFTSWFVDFDPVRAKMEGREPAGMDMEAAALFPDGFEVVDGREVPVGWGIKPINEIAKINQRTLKSSDTLEFIHYIEISEVKSGEIGNITEYKRGEEPSRARRKLQHGDTVLSTVRPERGSYFLCLEPSKNLIASTGFAVVSPKEIPWALLHSFLTQSSIFEHLGQVADGGAYPAVRADVIGSLELILPKDTAVLDSFQKMVAPLYELAHSNRNQSRTLAALRDTLLPKLITEEVRAPSELEEKQIS